MPPASVVVLPFAEQPLKALFPVQTPSREYLYSYLTDLGATSVLGEQHYVDRHYLDEYSAYYARSFNAPRAWCGRLHFFASLDANALNDILERAFASAGARDESEKQLQQHYLGFVVLRPLSGAAMGRTVLKTYPVQGSPRRYEAIRPYRVNIAGLRLTVDGLAYQQQDRGAAVCASTSLWSALQRVAFIAGHRTATPLAVTRAAQSPYPASDGLDTQHMALALSNLGYIADHFAPQENRAVFRAKVAACLQSHLPVILLITKKRDTGMGSVEVGHAVTVTGYSEPANVANIPPSGLRMRGGAIETLYVHDDNLGSHAHYELFDSTELNADGHPKLMLRRGRKTVQDAQAAASAATKAARVADPNAPATPAPQDWWPVDDWVVAEALVPKTPNLRLPIASLLGLVVELRPLVTDLVFQGAVPLHFSARFASGVDYKRSLFGYGLHGAQMRAFMQSFALPRHIGIISAWTDDKLLCDIVVDVSEVERVPPVPSILGIVAPGVPFQSVAWMQLAGLLQFLRQRLVASSVSLITGPPVPPAAAPAAGGAAPSPPSPTVS